MLKVGQTNDANVPVMSTINMSIYVDMNTEFTF